MKNKKIKISELIELGLANIVANFGFIISTMLFIGLIKTWLDLVNYINIIEDHFHLIYTMVALILLIVSLDMPFRIGKRIDKLFYYKRID